MYRLKSGTALADFLVPEGFIQATMGKDHEWNVTDEICAALSKAFRLRNRLTVYWVVTNRSFLAARGGMARYPTELTVKGKKLSLVHKTILVSLRPRPPPPPPAAAAAAAADASGSTVLRSPLSCS